MIKILLYRFLLSRLIAKSCESRIPRSGKKGEKVNCWVVACDQNNAPYFLVTKINGDSLSGLKYDGNSYAVDDTLSIADLDNLELRITHYYGLSEITFDSIYDVAFHYFTKFIYLKIHIYRYIDKTSQYFFNKRKVVTKKRMDLLRFMMDDQLDRTHEGIGSIDLISKIYSMRLFLHPSFEVQHKKLELYLNSLVASGEIKKTNDEYIVTGKAISTIEKYEEEERRHTEAVKLQRKMFWLTIIAVMFAIVQSGVIKLPTVADLTHFSINYNLHDKANSADLSTSTTD